MQPEHRTQLAAPLQITDRTPICFCFVAFFFSAARRSPSECNCVEARETNRVRSSMHGGYSLFFFPVQLLRWMDGEQDASEAQPPPPAGCKHGIRPRLDVHRRL